LLGETLGETPGDVLEDSLGETLVLVARLDDYRNGSNSSFDGTSEFDSAVDRR
jgi:hypothetical protein